MKVLVACECSGRVRAAFRARGHDAWSCDLFQADDQSPFHLQTDVRAVLTDEWDLLIGFPPCTHLAASGARHWPGKRVDGRQQAAIEFFLALWNAPVLRVAIENPVGIMSRLFRQPDQILQPWQFGEPESKATCLWLRWLPLLVPTNTLPLPCSGRWRNQTPSGQNRLSPSPDRAKRRGLTYQGIAQAMADQLGSRGDVRTFRRRA